MLNVEEAAESLRLSMWRVWIEAGEPERLAIVLDVARVLHWKGSLRAHRSLVSRMFSPTGGRALPAFLLLLLANRTGRDEFSSLILRAAMSHKRMRKVPAHRPADRRHG